MCLSQLSTSFVMTKVCLSQQNICHDKIIFVATKLLSRQIFLVTNVCCNKSFVTTKVCLSWQTFCHKNILQQAYFYPDKRCVLSQQTRLCCDNVSVMTKMILVAVPANESCGHSTCSTRRAHSTPIHTWTTHPVWTAELPQQALLEDGELLQSEARHRVQQGDGVLPQTTRSAWLTAATPSGQKSHVPNSRMHIITWSDVVVYISLNMYQVIWSDEKSIF